MVLSYQDELQEELDSHFKRVKACVKQHHKRSMVRLNDALKEQTYEVGPYTIVTNRVI